MGVVKSSFNSKLNIMYYVCTIFKTIVGSYINLSLKQATNLSVLKPRNINNHGVIKKLIEIISARIRVVK